MKNKKYLGMLGLGCATLLLTGCGGNKLTCTMTEEQEEMGKSTVELVVSFDSEGKKVENMDMEMTMELENDEMLDMYEGIFDGMCEEEDAPKNCKVKSSGKKITLTASGSAEDMDYEAETSKDDMKKQLEDEGFTCK